MQPDIHRLIDRVTRQTYRLIDRPIARERERDKQ